ncbi:MAG: hypothetical protein V7K40_09350 [Nostoc sp.]
MRKFWKGDRLQLKDSSSLRWRSLPVGYEVLAVASGRVAIAKTEIPTLHFLLLAMTSTFNCVYLLI